MFKPEKSKFLLFLLVLVSSVFGWFFVIAPHSSFQNLIDRFTNLVNNNVIARFPEDLVIIAKGGQISVNQPSPYCFIVSDDGEGIVFNTNVSSPQPSDLEPGNKYSDLCRPIAVVGQNYVIYPDRDYGYRVSKIPMEVDIVVDRSKVVGFVNQVLPVLSSVARYFYFAIPFVVTIFSFVYLLAINFWYLIIVKLVGQKLLKMDLASSKVSLYNRVLFFHVIFLAFDIVFLQYILKFILGQNQLETSFFLRNTIVISALTLYFHNSPSRKSKV